MAEFFVTDNLSSSYSNIRNFTRAVSSNYHSRCTRLCRFLLLNFIAIIIIAIPAASIVNAQEQTVPVYTDDSPEAWEMFGRAVDQIQRDNLPEAIRIYQTLLNKFSRNLVSRNQPINGKKKNNQTSPDTTKKSPQNTMPPVLVSVRNRVQSVILGNDDLLNLYQDMNETTAARLIRQGNFNHAFLNYFLTPSGLQAGFILAERQIRHARFASAIITLRQLQTHPGFTDSSSVKKHWGRLLALAGLYANDQQALDEGKRILQSLNNTADTMQAIRQLEDSKITQKPLRQPVITTNHPLENPRLSEIQSKPMWSYSFHSGPEDALAEKTLSPTQRQQIRAGADDGQFNNFVPTVCDDIVFASDGISIIALDRFDGSPRWRYPLIDDLRSWEKMQIRQTGPSSGSAPNLTIVATDGNDAIGTIYESSLGQYTRRSSNRLVCLNASTGQLRWIVRPADLLDSPGESSLHGSPILYDGKIIIILRTNRQRLASDYLVALDQQTGKRLWSRYIVSSPVARSIPMVAPTIPLIHAGMIYLSSPLGCITAVNAETGYTAWAFLQNPDPDLSRFTTRMQRPWENNSPVWTPAGILAESPNGKSLLLINPDSGTVRSSFRLGSRNENAYLAADENAAYLISEQINRIPFTKLETLASGLPENKTTKQNTKHNENNKFDIPVSKYWNTIFDPDSGERILGRCSLGSSKIVVPTTENIYLINADNGQISGKAHLNNLGSPLVIGAEVIVATVEGIDSYMPYSLAEPRLRARLKADPGNAAPAVSLARLAGRHHKYNDILPAIDLAVDAVNEEPFSNRNQNAQQQLFATLLELADDPTLAEHPGTGRRRSINEDDATGNTRNSIADDLFIRMDLIASSVSQRLQYLFALGSYLTRENRANEAVDAYQTILSTRALADGFHQNEIHRIRADLEAIQQLQTLLKHNGQSAYALYDDAAKRALTSALAAPGTDALHALIREYPVSQVAPAAALEAGIREDEAGKLPGALADWRLGLTLNPTPQIRGRLLGELITQLQLTGKTDDLLYEVRAVEKTNPETIIAFSDGRATPLIAWRRNFLKSINPLRRYPEIGNLDESSPARLLTGDELLLPLTGKPSPTIALIRTEREIHAVNNASEKPLWSIELDRAETALLEVNGEDALLWGRDRGFPLTLQQISLLNGSTIWKTNLWGQDDNNNEQQPDRSRAGQNPLGKLSPCVGQNEIIFAIASGDIVCVDRFTGKIRWTKKHLLPAITQAACDSFGFVVAGAPDLDHLDQSPVLIMLDLKTGNEIFRTQIPGDAPADWLRVDGRGHAVIAVSDNFIGFNLRQQRESWQVINAAPTSRDQPMVSGHFLYGFNADAQVQTIDMRTGLVTIMPTPRLNTNRAVPPKIYTWQGRTLLRTVNGIYIFDADGKRIGELARSGSSDLTLTGVAIAEDRAVILETRESLEQRNRKQLILYAIDMTGKRIERGIQPNTPLPKIDAAQAINNWIVVDTGSHILFFHAPANKPDN